MNVPCLHMSFEFVDSGTETTRTSSSAYDFVKGFITGQIALLSLLFFIVRFLFFRSVGPVTPSSNSIKLDASYFPTKLPKKKNSNIPVVSTPLLDNDSELLGRLFGLDHQLLKQQAIKTGSSENLISDETARWLTFILSKMIFDPLRVKMQNNSCTLTSELQEKLNEFQSRKSSSQNQNSPLKHLDTIQIKSVGIGNYYPSIDSYQLIYDSNSECCAFRLKCSWQDAVSLEIESALSILNLITLPFAISIKLKRLVFTAQLQSSRDGESIEVSCLPDDNLLIDLEVGSLVGHRTKLKDLPKIKNAIVDALKKIISDSIINPKCLKIPFPKIKENIFWSKEPAGNNVDPSENESGLHATTVNSSEIFSDKLEHSASEITDKSLISDESEIMNVFIDSRYDFDDIETEALMSNSTTTK